MGFWQQILAMAAVLVWASCGHLPRARRWIELAAINFCLSTAYGRLGLAYTPIFTLACDAALCLALYATAKTDWEVAILNTFRISLLLSFVYSFGEPLGQAGLLHGKFDHVAYVVGLEACNWLVLLIIGGKIVRPVLADGLDTDYPRLAAGIRYLVPGGSPRRRPPFWEKADR